MGSAFLLLRIAGRYSGVSRTLNNFSKGSQLRKVSNPVEFKHKALFNNLIFILQFFFQQLNFILLIIVSIYLKAKRWLQLVLQVDCDKFVLR